MNYIDEESEIQICECFPLRETGLIKTKFKSRGNEGKTC